MTQDEIIEMADKADAEADNVLNMKGEYHPNWHQVRDEIFAKLVAAKEREVCTAAAMTAAEEAIEFAMKLEREAIIDLVAMYGGSVDLEAAIRARGEA
jgi:hypothetical protein